MHDRNLFSDCIDYKCCRDICGKHRICRALCRNMFPGSIPEDCAAEIGCIRTEYVDTKCLEERALNYRECCLRRCRANNWSDEPTVNILFNDIGIVPVDCVSYCDAAPNILVDAKYGKPSPYI